MTDGEKRRGDNGRGGGDERWLGVDREELGLARAVQQIG